MSKEVGFMDVKNRKIGRKGEKVMRKKFKPNTQPSRTGNNKQVKSKEKQVTQSAYQPKKKDVNKGQGKSDGRETQNEGDDSGMTQCMEWDEIRGMDKGVLGATKFVSLWISK
ncbi:hypothetical protein Tco_0843946 [Tanacetum coccineum]